MAHKATVSSRVHPLTRGAKCIARLLIALHRAQDKGLVGNGDWTVQTRRAAR